MINIFVIFQRGSEDVESKLDEIIKCLEFVSEKDLFQGRSRLVLFQI